MSSSSEIGQRGEDLARVHLEKKGLKFLTANWSCQMGEIDLVMKDGETIVFVEVKLRSSASHGEGVDIVGWQKQQKLIRTAKQYQQKEDYWGDVRFDVISILDQGDDENTLEHLEHAFEATA